MAVPGPNDVIDGIRTALATTLAVEPSSDWLNACLNHLQNQLQRVPTTDDVLFQILYSDLRDVVRSASTLASDDGFQTAAAAAFATRNTDCVASQKLREGIHKSSLASHNYTQLLPESFMLLCQLEEVADVAKSAEQRLGGHSNNNNSNHQPHRGPRASASRCCKVFLSDGHSSGKENMAGTSSLMVGVETSPIPGLSPTSLAGSKVLLKGPLEIRHESLLLHGGNCVVLGGCNPVLAEHQNQARLVAQKKAGVGVEPTVRALIGSTGFLGDDDVDENNNDEAHEASGDVVRRPPQRQQQQQPRPSVPTERTSTAASALYNRNTSNIPNVSNNRSPLTAGRKRNASQISNHSNITTTRSLPSSAARNPYTSTSVRTQPTSQSTARNPYETSSTQQRALQKHHRPASLTSVPETTQASGSTTAARITPISNSHVIPNTTNSSDKWPQQSSKTLRNNTETSASIKPTQKITTNQSPPSPHFLYSDPPPPSIDSDSTHDHVAQKMAFPNLRKLLLEMVGNREMYQSYYQQKISFRVELLVPNPKNFQFDVVKAPKPTSGEISSPKTKTKSKKKYEYFTSALFGSSSHASSLLACKIHPQLLEPCFDVSANELRALSRKDGQRCQSITHRGGETVKKRYFSSRVWKATLCLQTDKIFDGDRAAISPEDKLGDLKHPILLLGID